MEHVMALRRARDKAILAHKAENNSITPSPGYREYRSLDVRYRRALQRKQLPERLHGLIDQIEQLELRQISAEYRRKTAEMADAPTDDTERRLAREGSLMASRQAQRLEQVLDKQIRALEAERRHREVVLPSIKKWAAVGGAVLLAALGVLWALG